MKCTKCDMDVELKWNYCPYCEKKINSINQLELAASKKEQVDDHCERCGMVLEKHWRICPKCGDENSFFSKDLFDSNIEVKKNRERKVKEAKRRNSKAWVLLDIFCLTFSFPFNLIYYFFIFKGLGSSIIDLFKADGIGDFIWSLLTLTGVGIGTWISVSVVTFFSISVFISSIYNVFVAKTRSWIWKAIFWLSALSGFIILLFVILGAILF